MVHYFALHLGLLVSIFLVFGWKSFKWYMLYIVWALFLFETFNYVEHYGIQRKKDANGINEPITKMHSWNYLSGAVLFRL